MKHLKNYNESIKHLLKPKSKEDIIKSTDKYTPFGAWAQMTYLEIDQKDIMEMIGDRIKESLDELDKIISEHTLKELTDLVIKVSEWVKKNGGNPSNIEDYGLKELSKHIVNNGISMSHDHYIIYDDDTFKIFEQLLKNMAICEAKYNNIESPDWY